MSVSIETWQENIYKIRELDFKGSFVAFRRIGKKRGNFIEFFSECGYYTLNTDLNNLIQVHMKYLYETVAGVYCIDQGTLLIKDPDLAKRVQEVKWPKEIKVITVADQMELISKTTDIFCRKSSFFDSFFK